jgi:peptide/nickel transport system substrate-binding protein
MRNKKMFPRRFAAGAFFLITTFAIQRFSAANDLSGDSFVISSTAEPTNLIPFLASDSASAEVSHFIFNGLLKYNEDLELVGDLAERWEVREGGLLILFYLRKNVFWQDGSLFSSKDVVFTYNKLTDPNVPTPYSGKFEQVESVRALDARTVEVRYKEPFSPGLSSWTMGIAPEHLLANEDLRNTRFARAPVGTGPYRLKKWVRGEKIELWANQEYFEGRPNLDRIVIRFLPDTATAFLELQAENLDTADLTPLQFSRQIETSFFSDKYKTYRWTGLQYTYLGYNLKHPIFKDKRVRQALAFAIRPEEMIRGVLMGHGRVVSGPFLPESWAANPDVKPFAYDPEEAKRRLGEAGWRDSDGDGILERDGMKFSFTVLTNGGNDARKMTCEILQKQLSLVGVEMKIQVMEWGTLLKEFIHPRRFDAVLMGWSLALDPDIYDLFHSSRTGPGQFNFVSFENAEVDRLLEEARRTFDQTERAALYRQAHALIYDEQPYAFLYAPESLSVLHKRFQNVKEGKLGIGFNFINWSVPKERQKYPLTVTHA